MDIKRLIDRSPRQVYHLACEKLLSQKRLQAFDEEHPCVFVLSTGRAGTRTMAQLLGTASNVCSYHEPSPTLFALSRLAYMHDEDPDTQRVLVEAFREARRRLFAYSLACNRGYVETGPHVTFLARAIEQVVPGAKFVHLVRDPRDVVRSGMRRGWYAGHRGDNTRIVPRAASEYELQWNGLDVFEKNAWLWAETNRWIMEFTSSLSPDRILLIYAEDIFAGQKESVIRLFEFLSASTPSDSRIAGVLAQRLNKQESGTFAKPEEWSQSMYGGVRRIAGRVAVDLGYEIP